MNSLKDGGVLHFYCCQQIPWTDQIQQIIKNQHRFIARSFLSQLSQISFVMDLFILIPRVNESVFCLSVLSDSKHQAHSLWLKM